jgi:hypothetical protein
VSITLRIAWGSMAVFCLAACGQRAQLPVSALVPSDAIAMLDLRWQEARSDHLLKQFAVLPRPATVIRSLGVSLDTAETVIAFSTSLDASNGGDTLIVSSPAVVREFIAAASGRRWIESSSGSLKIYDDPATRYRTLIVSESVLAIGPQHSIDRVVAVTESKAAPFLARSEFTDLADMFQTSEPVRMAVAWPMEVRDASSALVAGSAGLLKLGGLGGLGGVVEKFGIGRAMGMSCSRSANGLRCRLAGVMQDESTASIVSGGLTVLKGLASLVPEPPAQVGPSVSMSDLTVDRRGTTVTVGVSLR